MVAVGSEPRARVPPLELSKGGTPVAKSAQAPEQIAPSQPSPKLQPPPAPAVPKAIVLGTLATFVSRSQGRNVDVLVQQYFAKANKYELSRATPPFHQFRKSADPRRIHLPKGAIIPFTLAGCVRARTEGRSEFSAWVGTDTKFTSAKSYAAERL